MRSKEKCHRVTKWRSSNRIQVLDSSSRCSFSRNQKFENWYSLLLVSFHCSLWIVFCISLSTVLQLSWVSLPLHLLISFLLRLGNAFFPSILSTAFIFLIVSFILHEMYGPVCAILCALRGTRPDLWHRKDEGVKPPGWVCLYV